MKREAQNWIAVLDPTTKKLPRWSWKKLGPPARASGNRWVDDPLREKGLGLAADSRLDPAGQARVDRTSQNDRPVT